jgi:hypothetical protein
MSRFNVRAIQAPIPEQVHVPSDKKPSAYSAFKGRDTSAPAMVSSACAMAEPESHSGRRTGGGRPSKDELRRRKLDLADASIQILMVAKPNRAKVREYIQNRILALNIEKR